MISQRRLWSDIRKKREAWEKAHPYRAFWQRRILWPTKRFYYEVRFRLRVLIFGHECWP